MAGLEGCLLVYPPAEFEKLYEQLTALPVTDRNSGFVRRLMLGNTAQCAIDKQNRVLIPQELRTYAGLNADATVIGVGKWIEMWSPIVLTEREAQVSADEYRAMAAGITASLKG
jgi:MraZ protein